MYYTITSYNTKNKLESQTLHTRTNKPNEKNETTRTKQTIIKHAISLQGSRAGQVFTYHTDQQQQLF